MFLSSIGLNETQIVAKVETRQALLNFEVRFCALASNCLVCLNVLISLSLLSRSTKHTIRELLCISTSPPLLISQSILESASAIIMSRGVLGLDVAPEKMALVQKAAVAGCNMVGKPAIITVGLN